MEGSQLHFAAATLNLFAGDLHNPDFVKLAETYGVLGLRAETPEALASAIRRGFDHDGPTIIETPVGRYAKPLASNTHAASAGVIKEILKLRALKTSLLIAYAI